jgi:hypothetical protein
MGQDTGKTLFGLPIVVTDAVMPGTMLVGPMPTWEDCLRYGSVEKAIEARAKEFSKLTGLDDPILNADEIG